MSVYTDFVSNPTNVPEISSPTPTPVPTSSGEIPTISRETLLPYREYDNIAMLIIGSVHKLEAIGYVPKPEDIQFSELL